jgi:hypothetical protein
MDRAMRRARTSERLQDVCGNTTPMFDRIRKLRNPYSAPNLFEVARMLFG